MIDSDIATTVSSVNGKELRKSVKRKLDENEEKFDEEFEWMTFCQVKKRYRQVKKTKWRMFEDYESLLINLGKKIYLIDENVFLDNIKCKLKKIQKRAIDYVSIWDARTVKEALNWLAVHPEEECRRSFVQLVLKEQPEKNFSEALEQVCKAWDKIHNVYTYKELFNDDVKSKKVKLQYCNWLGTKIKERNVTLHKYWDLVYGLEARLSSDLVDFNLLEYRFRSELLFHADHAIDYVSLWDARTAEEALNWLIGLRNRFFATQFIEFVCVEQPEKNFWEALKRVCKAWDDIRKVYTYEELWDDDDDDENTDDDVNDDNDKSDQVKLKYCDWLRVKIKTVS